MNMERAAMMGLLAGHKEKRAQLRNRIKGQASAIRSQLNLMLTPADDLDVPVIDEQWDGLKEAWGELVSTNQSIRELEKELA
jgi:hypothetical protein